MKQHYPIQIRFCDLDSLGHINNAVFINYIETARVQWLNELELEHITHSGKIPLILARTEIDYLQPAFLDSKLHIELTLGKIGNKSFHLNYLIKDQTKEVAKASSVQVWYDYEKKSSIPIPSKVRHIFEQNKINTQ